MLRKVQLTERVERHIVTSRYAGTRKELTYVPTRGRHKRSAVGFSRLERCSKGGCIMHAPRNHGTSGSQRGMRNTSPF